MLKYEGIAGFNVADNGSVSCYNEWALERTVRRLGNELLTTTIADFALHLPFEEWPHWKQYSVAPPSLESMDLLGKEESISTAVNSMVSDLEKLNIVFVGLASSLGIPILGDLWLGSLESLAGRELKKIYPSSANDDDFLRRATLTSTFVIDGLAESVMRAFLTALEKDFHEKNGVALASRNLLRRVTLVAGVIENFRPDTSGIPKLVMQAEDNAKA